MPLQISPDQILFIVAESGLAFLLCASHFFRTRLSMAPFFGLAGVYSMMQWQLLQTGWWIAIGPWNFNAAIGIFLPVLLLGALITYCLDGLRVFRAYLLVVLTTSLAAWCFSLLRESLAQFVPLPYLIILSNQEHLAIITATAIAQLFSAAVWAIFQPRFRITRILLTQASGLMAWLIMFSFLNYGPTMGIANIHNETIPILFSGGPSIFLGGLYFWFAYRDGAIMPQRSLKSILTLWKAVEADTSIDATFNRDQIVSELRLLNDSLQLSSRVMEAHMEHAIYGVIMTDSKGRIKKFNAAATAIIPHPSLEDASISEILQILLGHACDLKQIEGQSSAHHKKVALTDSIAQWVELIATPLGGETKSINGPYYLIIKDVSQEVREEQRRLISNRIKDIHSTGRVFSHDFSNLLMGADAQIARLRCLSLPEEGISAVKGIEQALRRGREILRQVGAGSQFGAPQLSTLDLGTLIEEAMSICRAIADDHGIAFRFERNQPWMIEGDINQLSRVFTNLLKNALRASNRGDVVSIQIYPRGSGVETTISDQGCGMSDQDLRAAFDPGFSTKGQGEGGLGLSISYLMVDAHGGYLELKHNPSERGIQASVWLPASRPIKPAASLETTAVTKTGLSILVFSPNGEATPELLDQLESHSVKIAEIISTEELFALIKDDPEWDTLLIPEQSLAPQWLSALPDHIRPEYYREA